MSYPEPQPPQPLSPSDEKMWATLVHLGAIVLGFWPALLGYLLLKDRGPFIREHTRQALNFQITMTIASFVGLLLVIVLIGFFIVIGVGITIVVLSIIAGVAANRGEWYRYPLTYEFIK